MCKSIIKKKKEKHDKIVLFTKSKLNDIKALIFKALIDSIISFNVQCVIVKKKKNSKEQEAIGLLSSLGIKTPFSKFSLVVPLLL